MPLVQKLERADLTLSFVGPDDADRVTRDLKPGEVRLRARSDSPSQSPPLARTHTTSACSAIF
ncbi:hypothetical protein IHN63_19785, partial [Deinococcus sp. 6YEL10]|nr:hypothetical protein [Deinococcus sp. 6YEL10]